MTPEDELLITCLRQDFAPEHQEEVARLVRGAELDWDVILSAATTHGVAPLLHMNLGHCSPAEIGVPLEVMERLQVSEMQAIAILGSRGRRLEGLLKYLDSRSIDAMLVKGTALQILVYDRSWMTTADDIDLVLRIEEERFSGADREKFVELAGAYSIEYDFMAHHDVTMNGILPVDFQRIWADAQTADYRGQPCFVMSAEDMLISLCINSCRKRYFRLKSLFDIAETILRCEDMRWPYVAEKARAYRCNHMVYTALLATRETVGCRLPDTLWQDLPVSPMRSRIIHSEIERRVSQPLFGEQPTWKVLGRSIDPSLILPYITYRWEQIARRGWYVWRTRNRPRWIFEAEGEELSA